MILVTGAAGKTGLALIGAISRDGQDVKALVRSDDQVERVTRAGAAVTVIGDMFDRQLLDQAMEGVRKIYHICPNVHPDEFDLGKTAIDIASKHGIKHFVYHSVLHPQTEEMPHHWLKLRVEEELFRSGLPFTILQPAPYMQNILAGWNDIITKGIYTVPYPADTRLSLIDLQDVARAAVIVLRDSRHYNAVYELCGPDTLNQSEIAEVLSERLGLDVRIEVMERGRWKSTAEKRGLGAYQIDTLMKMFDYYARYGLSGSPRILNWLLGSVGTSFANFIDRTT
ncbi:MAG: SDR family oxidoreductase [Candidatus Promineifilaceae bacterium]